MKSQRWPWRPCLCPLTAAAQSSVTVFGVLDAAASLHQVQRQDAQSLGSDGLSSSRLGFRGVETWAAARKAGFWIETAVATDTGRSGRRPALLEPALQRQPDGQLRRTAPGAR